MYIRRLLYVFRFVYTFILLFCCIIITVGTTLNFVLSTANIKRRIMLFI